MATGVFNLTVSKTTNIVTAGSGITVRGTWYANGDVTNAGIIILKANTVASTISLGDGVTLQNNGTITSTSATNGLTIQATSGTAYFGISALNPGTDIDYSGKSWNLSGLKYYPAVTLDTAGESITLGGACTFVSGLNLSNASAFFNTNGKTATFSGDLNITAGTFTNASGLLVFASGTSGQKLTSAGKDIGAIKISAGSGATTLTLQDNLTTTGGVTIDLNQILSLNTKSISAGTLTNNGILQLVGNEAAVSFTGGIPTSSGKVQYIGTGTYTSLAAGNSYYDLEFYGTGGSWTIASTKLTVSGGLTITAGTLSDLTNSKGIDLLGSLFIASGGVFTKGSGTFTFTGSTTATWTDNSSGGPQNLGAVTIGNGTNAKQVNFATNVGATSITINTGNNVTIDNTSGTSLTLSGVSAWTWNSNFTFAGTSAMNLSSSAVTLGDNIQVTVNASTLTVGGNISGSGKNLTITGAGNTTISGVIGTGVGTLTKSGAGTLTLSGVNLYTGITTINAGTISISADTGLGAVPGAVTATSITFGGGTLATTATFTLTSNRGITLNAGGGTIDVALGKTLTYGGIITGSGALTKSSAGTLTLSGANTFTGALNVAQGTLQFSADMTITGNITIGTDATTTGILTVDSGKTLSLNLTAMGRTLIINADSFLSGSGELNVGALNKSFSLSLTNSGTINIAFFTYSYGLWGGGPWTLTPTVPITTYGDTDGAIKTQLTLQFWRVPPATGTITFSFSGSGTLTVEGDLVITDGSLDLFTTLDNSATNTNMNIGGNFTFTDSYCKYIKGEGATPETITFNGASNQIFTTNAQIFNAITLNGSVGHDLIISGNLDVNGNLNITSGDLDLATNDPNVTLAGNLTIGANGTVIKPDATGKTWTFDGATTPATWTDSTSGQDIGAVTIGDGSNTKVVNLTSNVKATSITIANKGTLGASAGTPTITVAGDWNSSAGTFTYGQSTVKLSGANNSIAGPSGAWYDNKLFYNLTVSGTYTAATDFYISNNLIVSGSLSIGSGKSVGSYGTTNSTNISGILTGSGRFAIVVNNGTTPVTNSGTISVGTFEYDMVGGSTTGVVTATTYDGNLKIANSNSADADTIAILGLSLGSLVVTGSLTITDSVSERTLTLNNSVYNTSISVGGNWDAGTRGAYTKGTTDTITFTGAAKTINSGGSHFNNLTIAYAVDGASVSLSGSALAVDGNLAIGEGTRTTSLDTNSLALTVTGNITIYANATLTCTGSSAINIAGNWLNSGTFTAGTGTVTFNGSSGTQTINSGGTGAGKTFYSVEINNGGTKVQLLYDLTQDSSGSPLITMTSGTLDLNGYTWAAMTAITLGSGTTLQIGTGTWSSVAGINLTGGTVTQGTGTASIKALTITTGTYTCSGASVIQLTGALTIASGSSWTPSSSVITMTGATKTINAGKAIYSLVINSPGTVSLSTNSLAQNAGGTLTMTAGTLDLNNLTLTLGADLTTAAGTIAIGTGTLAGGTTYSITLNTGSTITQGTGTLSALNLSINGTSTYTCTGASAINLSGNWSKANLVTFIPGTGTVTFTGTGTSTIDGSTTFYNLTASTAGKTLTFTRGTEQKVTNNLTLSGVTINATSGAGAVPKLSLQAGATQSINNVTVINNDASAGLQLVAKGSSSLSGTTNWVLGSSSTIYTWTGAIDTAWDKAGNWDLGAVPSATDTVIIPAGTPIPALSGSITLKGLTLNGTLDISSFTLTINGDLTTTSSGTIKGVNPTVIVTGYAGTRNNPLNASVSGTLTMTVSGVHEFISIALNGVGSYHLENETSIHGYVVLNNNFTDYGQKDFRSLLNSSLYRPMNILPAGAMPVFASTASLPMLSAPAAVPVIMPVASIAIPMPQVTAPAFVPMPANLPSRAEFEKITPKATLPLPKPSFEGIVSIETLSQPMNKLSFTGVISEASLPQSALFRGVTSGIQIAPPGEFSGVVPTGQLPAPKPTFEQVIPKAILPQAKDLSGIQPAAQLPVALPKPEFKGIVSHAELPASVAFKGAASSTLFSKPEFKQATSAAQLTKPVNPLIFDSVIGESKVKVMFPGGTKIVPAHGIGIPLGAEKETLSPPMEKDREEGK